MKYRKDWQLETIPFEEIPTDLLKSWWATYTNSQRETRAGGRPRKTEGTPEQLARRKQIREAARRRRQREKTNTKK